MVSLGTPEMYVYFRTKDQKFKPSKSQGDGLNWSSFLEEASNKGLVYRSDFFFGLCGCLSPAY